MEQLVLPRPPFEVREHYVRNNIGQTAVYGLNEQGLGYVYIEDDVVDSVYGLTVRHVPYMMDISSTDEGVFNSIRTFWRRVLVSPTGIPMGGENVGEQRTNEPDKITFSAGLGVAMMPSIINGKVRGIDGFDTQPLFRQDVTGATIRIPDTDYDTTLPPTGTYDGRQPQTVQVDETV